MTTVNLIIQLNNVKQKKNTGNNKWWNLLSLMPTAKNVIPKFEKNTFKISLLFLASSIGPVVYWCLVHEPKHNFRPWPHFKLSQL